MANIVVVYKSKKGQFLVTFPKSIAEALGLRKGDLIEFLFDKGDVIIRKK